MKHYKNFQDEVNGFISSPSRSTDALKKVQDVIKSVREGPAPLPSTTLYRVTNPYSNIQCATLSSDATMLVTGCEDSSLITWDLLPRRDSNPDPPTPQQQNGPEVNFNYSNDPSAIRLGCDDNNSQDFNQQDLKTKSILRGHSGPIYDATFMPRSNYVLSVSEDTTMRLWDLKSGLNRAIYHGHSYPIWSVDSDRVGVNIATGKHSFLFPS